MKTQSVTTILLFIWLSGCKPDKKQTPALPIVSKDTVVKQKTQPEPPKLHYYFLKKKDWLAQKDSFAGAQHLDLLNAINRTDSLHLKQLDSILVPSDFSLPLATYLPFPTEVDFLNGVRKIIIFSNSTQTFAAYENGKLVITGQTNTGRKTKPTPARLYFANWKAKETISTVDDEWKLKWNFNVHNTWGVGFHEYALPGYPASHSCMRLQESDAKFLYSFADQWILENNQLAATGTPVVVLGHYPFGKPRPWFALTDNPLALHISTDSLKTYLDPYIPEILKKQEQREQMMVL